MDDTWLRVFVAVTSGAVLLQAMILVTLYVSVRKSTQRMEALAEEVKSRVLPLL